MMSSAVILLAAANESSVSPALTVATRPLTGGMTSSRPDLSSSFEVSLLAHQTVIIETPKRLAMPVSVSPSLTS